MNILSLDIGGTFIKYGILNENFDILDKGKVETPRDSRESLVDALAAVYEEKKNMDIEGIAVSMPGIINSDTGYCYMGGGNLRYNDNFNIKEALAARCPVKIHIENDGKCAVMAELAKGCLQGCREAVLLAFGTNIGGGIITGGKLRKGKHFSAGEVSYISTVRDKATTKETMWGFRGSPNQMFEDYEIAMGLEKGSIDGEKFFAEANAGNETALKCLKNYSKEVAVRMFNIQTFLDIERFAIGGGVSAQPLFTQSIIDSFEELYDECPFSIPKAEIRTCMFRNDAGIIGAAYGLLEEEK